MDSSGDCGDIPGRVSNLRISEKFYIAGTPVEIQGVGPALLDIIHAVHVTVEEEGLGIAVIPAGIGRKHILFLPGIGAISEMGDVPPGVIEKPGGLNEDGIREHVHIVSKCELLGLGIVSS